MPGESGECATSKLTLRVTVHNIPLKAVADRPGYPSLAAGNPTSVYNRRGRRCAAKANHFSGGLRHVRSVARSAGVFWFRSWCWGWG